MALNVGELFTRLRVDMSAFTAAMRQARDQMRQNAEQARQSAGQVEGAWRDANGRLRDAQGRFIAEGKTGFAALGVGLGALLTPMGALTTAAVGLGASLTALGGVMGWGVMLNANLEQSTISFKTLLGSAEEAKAMIADLKEFAKSTPFEYDGVEKVSMSLLNAGLPAETLKDNLTKLGDAVAASGGNIQEKLEGAGIAIGQMAMKGKISAEEMQQLAERGLPAWEALARATGKSKQELMKLGENGELLSEEYLPKLIDGLGEMRKGAMLDQSKTMLGMFGTLKDEVKQFVQEVTGGAFGRLKVAFTGFVQQLEAFKKTEAFETFKKNLTTVFNGIANILIYFGQTVVPIVVSAFMKLTAWTAQHMPAIQSAFAELSRIIAFLVGFLADVAMGVFTMLAETIGWIAENMNWLAPTVTILTAAILGGIAAWKLYVFWTGIAPAVIGAVTTAINLIRSGMLLQTIATNIATAAQWAWNIALTANPIGIIVVAIGALIAAIIAAIYWVNKKTDFFKYMFAYVKTSVENAGNFLKLWYLMLKNNFLGIAVAFMFLVEKISWGMNKVGLMSDETYEGIKGASNSLQDSLKKNAQEIQTTTGKIVDSYKKTTAEVKKTVAEQKKAAAEAEAAEKKKETAAEDAFEAEQQKQEAIRRTINLAKAGVKEALTDLRAFAKEGHIAAIEAMAALDADFTKRLQENNKKSIQSMVGQLKAMKEMLNVGPINKPEPPKPTDFDYLNKLTQYNQRMQQYNLMVSGEGARQVKDLEDKIAKMQGIIDETDRILGSGSGGSSGGSSGGGSGGGNKGGSGTQESAQKKQFDASMKAIEKRKDLNQITMNDEYNAYAKMQQRLNRKTEEGADLWHQLEKKKYDLKKQMEEKKREASEKTAQKEKEKAEKAKEAAEKEKQRQKELEEQKAKKIEDTYNAQIKQIEKKKDFHNLTLEQELEAYTKLQATLNRETTFGAQKYEEIEKKKFELGIDIEREAYDKSIDFIERKKEAKELSFKEELTAYERMQESINRKTKDGAALFEELEEKKAGVYRNISQQIIDNTQKRISRMSKLTSDAARMEIEQLERVLKSDELTADDRASIEEELWDKRLEYAIENSEKIRDKTIEDIEAAKDAELDAIDELYEKKREDIEDRFDKKELDDTRAEREKKLAELRADEAKFMSATSKQGVEKLREIQKEIAELLDEARQEARDELKESLLKEIDTEEELAAKAAEAKAEQLKKEAETAAEKLKNELVNIATKTGATMDDLVAKIKSYGGSMYKAGANLIEQLGLGMASFKLNSSKIFKAITDIDNADTLAEIYSGGDNKGSLARLASNAKLTQPIVTNNSNTTNYNAPIIKVESVIVKDKTDAAAWAQESARAFEIVTRSKGGR